MKVIAISGGGAGIGRAIAWHFARAGYGFSIIDADRQAGKEALQGEGEKRKVQWSEASPRCGKSVHRTYLSAERPKRKRRAARPNGP